MEVLSGNNVGLDIIHEKFGVGDNPGQDPQVFESDTWKSNNKKLNLRSMSIVVIFTRRGNRLVPRFFRG
jgi:hypothetical protein